MSSEIEVAVKIGKVKLKAFHKNNESEYLELKSAFETLGVKLEKDPINSSYLNKHLRAITTHHGDKSFIRYMGEDLGNTNKDQVELAAFILGICYLYPFSSFVDSILPYLNDITNENLGFMDFHDYARKLYSIYKPENYF